MNEDSNSHPHRNRIARQKDGLKRGEEASSCTVSAMGLPSIQDGQYALGWMYANGRGGLIKDDAEAVRWYRKAAEQGHAAAKAALEKMQASGQQTNLNPQSENDR